GIRRCFEVMATADLFPLTSALGDAVLRLYWRGLIAFESIPRAYWENPWQHVRKDMSALRALSAIPSDVRNLNVAPEEEPTETLDADARVEFSIFRSALKLLAELKGSRRNQAQATIDFAKSRWSPDPSDDWRVLTEGHINSEHDSSVDNERDRL